MNRVLVRNSVFVTVHSFSFSIPSPPNPSSSTISSTFITAFTATFTYHLNQSQHLLTKHYSQPLHAEEKLFLAKVSIILHHSLRITPIATTPRLPVLAQSSRRSWSGATGSAPLVRRRTLLTNASFPLEASASSSEGSSVQLYSRMDLSARMDLCSRMLRGSRLPSSFRAVLVVTPFSSILLNKVSNLPSFSRWAIHPVTRTNPVPRVVVRAMVTTTTTRWGCLG
ncbi:Uncharacterized protein HZ326_8380 [Fusarium oxysporum f. sp. albedinis]|nr:Uncharacterized protein HZ326_8380 [Fusarium oxysporum f. sp. albedinis]